VYDDAARRIVDAVLEGFNGTIFAYGQTSTGKTYSMEGNVDSQEHKGIILHAFDHIFAHISSVKDVTFPSARQANYISIGADRRPGCAAAVGRRSVGIGRR
jgi:hypothetical protein